MINPNDPQDNPDMFLNKTDPSPLTPAPPPTKPRTRPEPPIGRGAVRPTQEADFRRTNYESDHGGRGRRPARSARPSASSEQSFERSPLHQAKVMGSGGGGSPAWEGRNYDSSHGNVGGSRLRPTRGYESPEKGAAVPRFGEWNENDPQSAENFTLVFNKVRQERNTGPGNPSATPKHPSYSTRSQPSNEPKNDKILSIVSTGLSYFEYVNSFRNAILMQRWWHY
ncbi:hypothetical protein DH2020_000939 [Rehmannia glutinosa]|uniref:RIN4 pathogenic type III effector avirulence factor Avr cleavage site domain-containing protein n=1 Tax=Rehmannia glutinosa TaxID=99300 RepID=A0ABR0XYM4_REHGL